MSALLTGKAFEVRVGPSQAERNAKQVLTLLANFADENDRAWPSVDTLADKLECSPSAIKRALRILEAKGLIVRDENYGTRYGADRSPFVYQITIDDAEQVTKQRRRAKAKAKEREKAREQRGFTRDTPRDTTAEPPRGFTNDHDGGSHVTPRGGSHVNERGFTREPQTLIEHPIQHPRESTRANKTENQRRQTLTEFQPDETLQALADQLGFNLAYELEKFRDANTAKGTYPADPAAAFRNWLKHGAELGINGKPTDGTMPALAGGESELERRARKLVDSSTPLKRRQPDAERRHAWIPAVARLLGKGRPAPDIVALICTGNPEELNEIGIEMDDLEEIA
ncbi:helix-turn-helix domain-containing protein [Bifidobacterium scaligerum]|uniref:Helix-turn-helix domain-containing protein n=1 Tax=Bifidobacterium scaligerum TaxID=2052656 RepID=A0A2M9HT39_9BIFI|nr:helix-turn-helix domain-containing protein [Bifidobacterium scaligerum]PJM79982.1 hypothetical protein CUU80_02280 [Bifidobacterium scaligerum]